jgi:hypothetical protein
MEVRAGLLLNQVSSGGGGEGLACTDSMTELTEET